jgi:hypothetical protein
MNKFIDFLKKLATWKWWHLVNEYVPFILAVLLWFFFVPIGQLFDPSLGGMSFGYFEMMLFGTVKFTWFNLVAWLIIRLVFPKVWSAKDGVFKEAFGNGNKLIINMSIWRRVLFISVLYVVLVLLQYFVDRGITLPTL